MWTPDVYQGSPSAVTAFMSSGAKIAGFAALLRVFATAFPSIAADMTGIFWGLAALTMILGNVIAISQTNIKRLLAYSSIAHAGYILMAFVPYGNPDPDVRKLPSRRAVLSCPMPSPISAHGAWSLLSKKQKAGDWRLKIMQVLPVHTCPGRRDDSLHAFADRPASHAGLVGKIYLFRAVIDGGFYGLAIIGVLTSLVSAYYYLRVVVIMYMRDGEPETEHENIYIYIYIYKQSAT